MERAAEVLAEVSLLYSRALLDRTPQTPGEDVPDPPNMNRDGEGLQADSLSKPMGEKAEI